MPSRPVTHLGVVSPRQDIVCHFGTQVCDQLTRTGKREAEHGRDVGEDVAFVSVRPSEEADKNCKNVKKEPTVVEEVHDREEERKMYEVESRAETQDFDLPSAPAEEAWEPSRTPSEWCVQLWTQLPKPLRQWIERFEPSMRCTWRCMVEEKRSMLPVLTSFARQFQPADRRGAVEWLFRTKGLLVCDLVGDDSKMFEMLFCGLPDQFGHVDFRVEDDMTEVKVVMAVADCFLSLVDDQGFSSSLHWSPLPMARDPTNFKAGGIHSAQAKKKWDKLHREGPGVSKWVLEWVHKRVWFVKNRPHKCDLSARNAPCFDKESRQFDGDKFEFMSQKVADMVRVGAVIKLPAGHTPDVLTRLSLAPKPGLGETWRVIMDMRPENECYDKRRVRMEHLGHLPAVFTGEELLFSCDLKSAYYSIGVDPRLGRTMGFQWEGSFYRFTCIPFGFSLAPWTFVKTGRQILKKWRAQGPGRWATRFESRQFREAEQLKGGSRCMLYMDDTLGGHKLFGAAVFMRNAQMIEFEDLGFSMSAKGELLPFPLQKFLGMLVHFGKKNPSWHLPKDKEDKLKVLAEKLWADSAVSAVQCREAASCVGKLVSATKAVPVAKLLFRELNWSIYGKGAPKWSGKVDLSKEARDDLRWVISCLGVFNRHGAPIWIDSTIVPVECVLVQDAGPRAIGYALFDAPKLAAAAADTLPTENILHESQSFGRDGRVSESTATSAGVVETLSVATTCGTIELTDEESLGHHVHKELLGVLLALQSRRAELRHRRICVFVDSTSSVAYLANWGGPSKIMTRLIRQIWSICAVWDIRIVQVSHISGDLMISAGVDALSRPYRFARGGEADRDEWRLRAEVFEWVQGVARRQFGSHLTIDRMASRANTRLARFCSVSSVDPDAEGFSAFAGSWYETSRGREFNYCFPPFAFIPRVLQHAREHRAFVAMVVPDWPSQCWWREMLSMVSSWHYFPTSQPFERVKDGEWMRVTSMSFKAILVLLDGSQRVG